MNNSSIFYEDISHQNLTSFPTFASASELDDKLFFYFSLGIIASGVILSAVIIICILFPCKRRCCGCCCLFRQKRPYGIGTTVPREGRGNHDVRNYGSQLSAQSELSHVIDMRPSVSDTPSLQYGSEYDNLSLNPALNDGDYMESAPEYEHPPSYEWTKINRNSKH